MITNLFSLNSPKVSKLEELTIVDYEGDGRKRVGVLPPIVGQTHVTEPLPDIVQHAWEVNPVGALEYIGSGMSAMISFGDVFVEGTSSSGRYAPQYNMYVDLSAVNWYDYRTDEQVVELLQQGRPQGTEEEFERALQELRFAVGDARYGDLMTAWALHTPLWIGRPGP